MEDLEIVELYWQRDERAIKETSNKYEKYCYSIAYNILHNSEDSKECINDTYLETWEAIPPAHPYVLSTFVGKITRRLSINKWKSLSAEKRGGGEYPLSLDELEECVADNRSIKDEIDVAFLTDLINKFLSERKEIERKVFVCRYWYFDSIGEISLRFGFTQSKVKMMLKRTRDELREYLEKEGISV